MEHHLLRWDVWYIAPSDEGLMSPLITDVLSKFADFCPNMHKICCVHAIRGDGSAPTTLPFNLDLTSSPTSLMFLHCMVGAHMATFHIALEPAMAAYPQQDGLLYLDILITSLALALVSSLHTALEDLSLSRSIPNLDLANCIWMHMILA